MNNNHENNNYNAFYWPCLPVAGMAYNQQVLPNNMNINLMSVAAPRWYIQTLAAQMTLQNYYNNEAITIAANKSTMLPPTVSNTMQAGNQKRKVADAADLYGSPPKKKVYKKRYCKAENCTKWAKKGRVCVEHGAKVKYKRCSRKGCEKFAVNGGVCIGHGATRKKYLCRFPNCTNIRQLRGEVCRRHRNYIPPQGKNNMLCVVIKDGGNQCNASAVVEISDNEEAADDRNESPMAIRKRKENVADQNKRGLSIEDNPAVDKMGQVGKVKDNADNSNYDDPEKSSADRGGGNMKHDAEDEEDPSGIGLQKEKAEGEEIVKANEEEEEDADVAPVDDGEGGRGHFETEGNQEDFTLNDVRKNEGIDVALRNNDDKKEDEGGGMSEMEKDHEDNMADDDHYEFDAGDDNGDVFSESHVVPDEIVAAGPSGNEVDRDTEIERLTAELEKERNLSEHVADKYESAKSQLQVKDDHIQSLRNDIEEMTQEMKEMNADKADIDTQLMKATTARLQERVDKEAAYRDVERLEAEKEELTEQLKEARSNFEAAETFWTARRENKQMLETEGANVEVRREVRDLKRDNAALKGQAANAKMMEMRANGRANLAMLEVLSLEREKDEVQAANEVLRGTVEELRETNEALCNNRLKFKLSSRMKKQERENRTI